MGQQSVDIVIRARDEASKVFNLAETAFTNMQRKIAEQYQQTPSGFSGQMQKQFEARAQLENNLFNLTHTAKEVELNDAKNHFDSLRNEWKDNQSMLTLIEQDELAKRKTIEERYTEDSLATFRRWRTQYIGIIKTLAVTGLGLRGLEGITGGLVTWRDEGFGKGFTRFVENIPLIGSSMNKLGDNIAELFVNSNAKIREANKEIKRQLGLEADLNELLKQKTDILKEINLLRLPPGERTRAEIEQERAKQLELLDEKHTRIYRLYMESIRRYNPDKQAQEALKDINQQKKDVNTLYDLKIIDMETAATEKLTRAKKELSFAEEQLMETRKRVLQLWMGEETYHKKQIWDDEKLTLRGKVELWLLEKVEEQLNKNKKAMDLYKDAYDDLKKELSTGGKDKFDVLLYNLRRGGVGEELIKLLKPDIELLRSRETKIGRSLGPTPGWAPFESKHMVGWQAPSLQINYEAQTARNTAKTAEGIARVERLQEKICAKLGPSSIMAEIN